MSWASSRDFFAGCGLRSSPVGVLDTPGVYENGTVSGGETPPSHPWRGIR